MSDQIFGAMVARPPVDPEIWRQEQAAAWNMLQIQADTQNRHILNLHLLQGNQWNDPGALGYQNAEFHRYQKRLEQEAWRQSVSRNWLNVMLDIELGIY